MYQHGNTHSFNMFSIIMIIDKNFCLNSSIFIFRVFTKNDILFVLFFIYLLKDKENFSDFSDLLYLWFMHKGQNNETQDDFSRWN